MVFWAGVSHGALPEGHVSSLTNADLVPVIPSCSLTITPLIFAFDIRDLSNFRNSQY